MKKIFQDQKEPVHAVCYYRVSSNIQSDLRQENDVMDYCRNNNITIAGTFRESISGRKRMSKQDRPELAKCIEYLNDGNLNLLVCSELSRLGRTPEVVHIIDELTQKKICVISLKENIRTLDDSLKPNMDQLLMVNIINGLAMKEADTLSYRVKSGLRSAVIRGRWTGGKYLPYGYKSVNGILTIDKKEAAITRKIFRKFNSGWGAVRIANWLNDKRIPTKLGKEWGHTKIRKIMMHPIYSGIRTFDNVEYPAPQLKIISECTYNKARRKIEDTRIHVQRFKKKYDVLFDSKLMRCGTCGRTFIGVTSRNVYQCSSSKYSSGCGSRSLRMNKTEQAIQNHLLENYCDLVNQAVLSDIEKNNQELLVKGEMTMNIMTGKLEHVNARINKKLLHEMIDSIVVFSKDDKHSLEIHLADGNSFSISF